MLPQPEQIPRCWAGELRLQPLSSYAWTIDFLPFGPAFRLFALGRQGLQKELTSILKGTTLP